MSVAALFFFFLTKICKKNVFKTKGIVFYTFVGIVLSVKSNKKVVYLGTKICQTKRKSEEKQKKKEDNECCVMFKKIIEEEKKILIEKKFTMLVLNKSLMRSAYTNIIYKALLCRHPLHSHFSIFGSVLQSLSSMHTS